MNLPASAPVAEGRAPVSRLRLWAGLVVLAGVGILLATPLFLGFLQGVVASGKTALPLGALLLLQDVQALALASLAAAVGVWTAPQVGLDAPLLRGWLSGERVGGRLYRLLPDSVLAGTVCAAAVLVVSVASSGLGPAASPPKLSPWVGATGAFYGGIVEEILTRWGLLSLLFFGVRRLGASEGVSFWVANLAAALAFGLLHLPLAFQLGMPRTPAVLAYLLAGNGVVGLVCGWLFRRRGLESAMLAHGSADVWLHAVFPALGL